MNQTAHTRSRLGQTIRSHRDALGITQTEAARRAGCTQQAWSALERGTQAPSWNLARRVAHTLGVTLADLDT